MRGNLKLGLACAAFVALTAAAHADTDPVAEHYRAYQAAFDRGDVATEVHEAQAALAASEARDHDGGQTAALALNLAMAELDNNNPQGAYAPAQRAFQLSQAHAIAGIDPLLVRLTLGEAEMAGQPASGRDRLLAALGEAQERHDLDVPASAAAIALGNWALAQQDYVTARTAWHAAAVHADGAVGDPVLARGKALVTEATAVLSGEQAARLQHPGQEPEDVRPILDQALHVLAPLVQEERADGQLNDGRAMYGQALAWRSFAEIIRDKTVEAEANGAPSHIVHSIQSDSLNAPTTDYCPIRWTSIENDYPAQARQNRWMGVVTMLVTVNAQGEIANRQVVSTVPNRYFAETAARMTASMHALRDNGAAPGCRMARDTYMTIEFTIPSVRESFQGNVHSSGVTTKVAVH